MLTFNKGEWAEVYCIMRVLAEQQLKLCDAHLTPTTDIVLLRGGRFNQNHTYRFEHKTVISNINGSTAILPREYFSEIADGIFSTISTEKKRTFSIPFVEKFLTELGLHHLKGKSSQKADITLFVEEETEEEAERGFSIKSFLAGNPTLVNASKATNFTYIVGLPSIPSQYGALKAKQLMRLLHQDNIDVCFEETDSPIYKNNLMQIDLAMPLIVAEALKIYFSSEQKTVAEIVSILKRLNPLHLGNVHLYEQKFADFLFYSAVGMFPNTPWEGMHDIDGGCLLVKKTGEVVTFYIFRNLFLKYFREYLLQNSYLDTASTTRHGFARLYHSNGAVKVKLNLQVRLGK
jgi:type II restriction enzyme